MMTSITISRQTYIVLFMLMILLSCWVALAPIYRYLNHGSVPDIGIFVEALSDASQGGLFENHFHYWMFTSPDVFLSGEKNTISMFASHFRPFLYLIVPLFKLFPSAITLLIIQASVIGISIWPAFCLAYKELQNEKRALILTLCYSLYPTVLAASWSFFPSFISTTLLMWAFWFAAQNKLRAMILCLIITLSTKEIMALPVLSFGVYTAYILKKRLLGTVICIISLGYLFMCTQIIIPHFGENIGYFYTQKIYGTFGHSLPEIVTTLLFKPWKAIPFVFSTTSILYLLGLLAPLAFLPLVGWRLWLLNLPVLLQNLLVDHTASKIILRPGGFWSAPMVPFTFMSVIWAVSFLGDRIPKNRMKYVFVTLMITALVCVPLSKKRGYWSNPVYKDAVVTALATIPDNARVSTNVLTGWCQMYPKYETYRFPKKADSSDYIFVAATGAANRVDTNFDKDKFEKKPPKIERWRAIENTALKVLNDSEYFQLLWQKHDPKSGNTIRLYAKQGNI